MTTAKAAHERLDAVEAALRTVTGEDDVESLADTVEEALTLAREAANAAAGAHERITDAEPHTRPEATPWGQPGQNLVRAIAAVMTDLGRIPKTGTNKFDNYDYATESDVADAIRPLLGKHGLAFLPTVAEADKWDAGTTRQGTQQWGVTIALDVTVTDGETAHVSRWFGEAIDRGDKAYYKAYTGALKYALLKTFCAGQGDDPEQDSPEPTKAPPRIVPAKLSQAELRALDAAATRKSAPLDETKTDPDPIGDPDAPASDDDKKRIARLCTMLRIDAAPYVPRNDAEAQESIKTLEAKVEEKKRQAKLAKGGSS